MDIETYFGNGIRVIDRPLKCSSTGHSECFVKSIIWLCGCKRTNRVHFIPDENYISTCDKGTLFFCPFHKKNHEISPMVRFLKNLQIRRKNNYGRVLYKEDTEDNTDPLHSSR